MKLWKITSALLTASFVASTAVAQTNEETKKELDALKAQVAAQSQRISELETGTAREESVENEINRLSERLAAGTTVNSMANKLTFTGEFRFRGQATIGDENASGTIDHDGWFNSSRMRFGVQYDFNKDVTAAVDMQTNWAWGENSATAGGLSGYGSGGGGGYMTSLGNGSADDSLRLYQAWLKVSNLFGRPEFSAKMGRQEVVLGNQFQFGNADWYNGYAFDGARYEWNSDNFRLTGLWLRTATEDSNEANQFNGFAQSHRHDEVYSIYFTLKTIKKHELDLYWIYANQHVNGSFNSNSSNLNAGYGGGGDYWHTIGARIGGNVDVASGMDWNLEGAYQFGADPLPGIEIKGFAIEGEVGVTFNADNKIRAWIRGLFADGGNETGTDSGYIPLFVNRHSNTANFKARYGAMDIFPMSNVFALTGGVHFDPSKEWTVGLNGTWGQADETFGSTLSDSIGFEVDLWAEYRYSEALTFSTGAALLFPDDQLEAGGYGINGTQFLFWMQARLAF